MCNNWPDFPRDLMGATGGLIGNTIIICGGYSDGYEGQCYSLTSEKAMKVQPMSIERMFASSIVLNDNKLWVTGGYDSGILASTDYVTVTGSIHGPDLPMSLYRHAIVAINSTFSMVIAGFSNDFSASTFYYDHNEGEWTTGPSLMQARYRHAAGIVTDEVTDENFVAVTGGYGDSTEILQDGNWVQGNINNATICYLFGKKYSLLKSIAGLLVVAFLQYIRNQNLYVHIIIEMFQENRIISESYAANS